MLKSNIREYQQEIIDTIMRKIKEGKKEIFIEMAAGTGKSTVVKELISQLNFKDNILILTKTKLLEEQDKEIYKDFKNVEISSNYGKEKINHKVYKYVILKEIENISEEEYKKIYQIFNKPIIISFLDRNQSIKNKGKWLQEKTMDYSLKLQQVIDYGYMNPNQGGFKFENFIEKLLLDLNIGSIERDVALQSKARIFRADFIINNINKKIIIETKSYRSEFIQDPIINQAVEQLEFYREIWKQAKEEEIDCVLILSCKISDEIKHNYYKERGVLIVDISNLIYLSQEHDELRKTLIESIQYNLNDILPKPPLTSKIFEMKSKKNINETVEIVDKATNFIKKLENMNYGRQNKSDKKYEKLCIDIIDFLFRVEFTRMSEQNSTEDKMFRMDLLCGLKGSSEFWKILMQHYNTRFVVFEFKNYEDEIDQNLVYITEKYLYNAVLRNVAIVISRNGFSHNARKAAIGMLTESGKLIIDLKDDDIITMLRMKADGQDASDYMLYKLEEYLMSISK